MFEELNLSKEKTILKASRMKKPNRCGKKCILYTVKACF